MASLYFSIALIWETTFFISLNYLSKKDNIYFCSSFLEELAVLFFQTPQSKALALHPAPTS